PALVALERAVKLLGGAAQRLGACTLFTEQYPRGLGPTLPALLPALSGAERFEKVCFSAFEADGFAARLREQAVSAVVVLGIEAHVCVFQTVRDLLSAGFVVHVPIDGVCSRRDDHKQAGLELCRRAGAVLTTAETVVFDWLERAGSDDFRELSKLIR
ncbi:MAG: isochorismatase family protein, partial [Polyangiaceae bacterium]